MPTTPPVESTILIVDDNETTRYMLTRILKKAGFVVLQAETGAQALLLAQRKPDLITLDVHLPDMSGIEVCRRIKDSPDLRAIPVIHISATFVRSQDQANALNSGADGYLTHPLEDVVLTATVQAFLRARRAEKERELLLEQSRRDLEALQAERDLRERFVATLTHDLRTPMTAAKMSAQLILRQTGMTETTQRLVSRVQDNIDRADGMIRDLLDANRVRAGEKLALDQVACDLTEVVENTLEDLISTHGDRFALQAPDSLRGTWDCKALQRVVENLAGNAIKYGAPYRPVKFVLEDRGEQVRLSVHNEGAPLSEGERAGLFRLYSRTASAQQSGQKGWGLGLTIVRGIVEAHGGTVDVASSVEAGTTFTVTLPKAPPSG